MADNLDLDAIQARAQKMTTLGLWHHPAWSIVLSLIAEVRRLRAIEERANNMAILEDNNDARYILNG